MKEIIIIPHIGIGQLKLGMAPDELEKTLLQMKRQWSNSSNEAMQMERCAETDDPNLITGRLGRMLSRNRHGQEKSHRIAFLSR